MRTRQLSKSLIRRKTWFCASIEIEEALKLDFFNASDPEGGNASDLEGNALILVQCS